MQQSKITASRKAAKAQTYHSARADHKHAE